MAENAKKFTKQFTSRLSETAETELNQLHAALTAQGMVINTGTEMLTALIGLSKTAISGGVIEQNPETNVGLQEARNHIMGLQYEKDELKDTIADLSAKLQDAISEAGKYTGGEFFAYDDPLLSLAWNVLKTRNEAGKGDDTLKVLVHKVFKFLMLPDFNKQIDKSEMFSSELYQK